MPLNKTIYRTLAYFSYFGYPLTVFEIYKWQSPHEGVMYSYHEIWDALQENDDLKRRVENKHGHYAIRRAGGESVSIQLKERKTRFLNAIEKYKKLQKVVRYLSRISSIKGIAICNSLAFHFTREKSDIDLLIITEEGETWNARLQSVLPLILLKQRPGEAKKNPIDLSFFLAKNHFDISQLKAGDNDPYLAVWTRSLVPIYGDEEVFEEFYEKNTWAEQTHQRAKRPRRAEAFRARKKPRLQLPSLPEQLTETLQESRFPDDIVNTANRDSRVMIAEGILKFHKNDRRAEISQHMHDMMSLWTK
jgi:hypothetical protein